jgi:hypothetical protein
VRARFQILCARVSAQEVRAEKNTRTISDPGASNYYPAGAV